MGRSCNWELSARNWFPCGWKFCYFLFEELSRFITSIVLVSLVMADTQLAVQDDECTECRGDN